MPEITDTERERAWPALPIAEWQETCETLQLWMQIVGKVRLERAPYMNHWWQVPLYLTARGLTTSPMPAGTRVFEIDFDFLDQALRIDTDGGERREIALRPRSVADFYAELTEALHVLKLDTPIRTLPVEIAEVVPFDQDTQHTAYDSDYAQRFWRVLVQAHRALTEFRGEFLGKVSPVHFFWGSMDLAVTRFSGRPAPPHPGGVPHLADWVTREAYSHEVSSAGFWPGGMGGADALFYSYAYPEPEKYADWPVPPSEARYDPQMREFVLPYAAVRAAPDPDRLLREFFQSTYEAAAERAQWDRKALERVA